MTWFSPGRRVAGLDFGGRHARTLGGRRARNWETVDPEKWVPTGYACVRVDSRGAGRSPGYLDPFSPRETRDYAASIEWAGTQPRSSGKVGLLGISYYAINQWQVAALRPPHLAAICPGEGASDFYRDVSRHGGILHTFIARTPAGTGRPRSGCGSAPPTAASSIATSRSGRWPGPSG